MKFEIKYFEEKIQNVRSKPSVIRMTDDPDRNMKNEKNLFTVEYTSMTTFRLCSGQLERQRDTEPTQENIQD
jgi:hypothetical protein